MQNIISRFFGYVEIKTKITSVMTFFMTLAYLFSTGGGINIKKTAVFFFGMLFFDMTATAINNFCDTSDDRPALQFGRKTALMIILVMLAFSAALGIYLVLLTDAAVLLLGGLCFLCGIFYSFGPAPVSGGPYGEILSGFFYGFLIPLILTYINSEKGGLFDWEIGSGILDITINIAGAARLAAISVVPFCLTADIMLANNICDHDRDIKCGRFTLPHYLGRDSQRLFAALYYAAYLSIIAMAALRMVSPISLLTLLTVFPVRKNIKRFHQKQIKEETFIVSIQNFMFIIIPHTALMLISGLLLKLS